MTKEKFNITSATQQEIADFTEKAWSVEDEEHFDEQVDWVRKDFIFKATQGEKIVGVITGEFEAGVTYIEDLIVDKEMRRQGIGKILVEEVEQLTKDKGGHKVFLFTMEEWGASRLYESLGYEITGNLPNHCLGRDFVIYSKNISE